MCEMRFYVPNLEEVKNDAEKPDAEAEEENEEEQEEVTPARQFNERIRAFTGQGDAVGDIIASIKDLPLQVPRGKLDLEMYDTYAKLHGKTHNYKILYKDIVKVFQLPRTDINKVVILMQLKRPLLQGQTMHHFILFQFDRDGEQTIKVNLTQEEIDN